MRDLFEPLGWVFVGLLAVNLALFVAIVVQREQWVLHRQLRERIRKRLAPLNERLLDGKDAEGAAEDLRPVIAGLGPQSRAVGAWLVLDRLREGDEATRAAVSRVLGESGAIDLAESATRRWMPWRRALACEVLGTIGTEHSVDVLVPRLRDKRAEVRIAAARALGQLGHPAAAGPLTELFLRRESIPTGVAYDALSRLGAAGADAFVQGLESPEPTLRVTSCFGIASLSEAIARPDTQALLVRRLRTDGEPRVRSAAARAMQRLPGEAAPEALLEGLQDPAPAVRRSAARALATFDDPEAVTALAGTISDEDRETALRSAESLLALSEGVRAGEAARQALAASRAWTVDSARAVAGLGA